MNDQYIIASDENIYKMCEGEKINGVRGIYSRIAKKEGVSRETISRKCRRYKKYLGYRDIFDVLPYKIASRIVNYLLKHQDKAASANRTTLYRIFKMTDRELRRFPMIGPKRIKKIREIQNEHRN